MRPPPTASCCWRKRRGLRREVLLFQHLFDWWPENTALTFTRPWLLWLLLVLPVIAWLRGRRGAAAALIFSSTSAIASLGKRTTSRAGKLLRSLLLLSLACLIVALAR